MEKAGLAVAAAGVVVTIVALVGSGSGGGRRSNAPLTGDQGRLVAVDLDVHDVPRFSDERAYLEAILHNRGRRLVVIDGARVEIRHVYELRRCASQDDIPLSHVYGLVLPTSAHPGQAFETSLHQQVGPDEADRFRIELSTKLPARGPTSLYLFEIEVSLQTDGPKPDLPLGTAAVSLPELPLVGEYYWDAGTPDVLHDFALYEPKYARYLRRFAMPCWRSNTASLRRVMSGDKARSKDLEQIAESLVEPSMAALE